MRSLVSPLIFVVSVFAAQQNSAPNTKASNSVSATDRTLTAAARAAIKSVDAERIRQHVRFLSHDLLEGRGTGQRGGDIAAEYIATQFALYGLKPAGDNGSYMQRVPLVGVTPLPQTRFSVVSGGKSKERKPLEEYVAHN